MENKQKALPKRPEISEEYKWRLEDIFATDELWEQQFNQVKERLGELDKFTDKLQSSGNTLLECLKFRDEISLLTEQLFVYAKMRKDEDNTNTRYQALNDRITSLSIGVDSGMAYILPEILAIPEDTLNNFRKTEAGLAEFQHYLNELTRQKEHILTTKEEQLLAQTGELAHAPQSIFGMLNNADIKFPSIKAEQGEVIEVTKGRYIQFMESSDRRVRQEAFTALYSTYQALKNTISTTLNASVKKDVFYSRVRKYNSALAAALDDDNMPISVYENLIKAVRDNLEPMYRYVQLRKRVLGLDELHMYDLYTPIVKDAKMNIPYQEAVNTVVKALEPLGSEYLNKLIEGFRAHWVDVYENEGKTGGAYSWGSYGTHPYVLLNYQDTLNDMFTIAHEMGHALHTFYSNQEQPYINAHYKIFLAEVASTLNEALLMKYLLKTTTAKKEKLYLLNHYLEQFRGTVYRQTMFAEFEKLIHEHVEAGEALTAEQLNSLYHQLNVDYYGPDMVVNQEIDVEWSRIPHFYNAFYVYKYATGFSAATALAQQILNEGQPAVDRYLEFLKGGNSNYPLNLLQKAGVDMTSPQPVATALAVFKDLVQQMEELLEDN
jgi:oligoendopeptidase F